MPRRSLALSTFALLLAAAVGGAQSLAGTYTAPNQQGGTITLELKALAGGKLGGTLAGNGNTFQLDGAMNGAMAEGTITGNGMKMFFGAQMNGDQLQFIMVEPDANGQPNFQRATPIQFKRGPAAAPAQSGNPLASSAGGNPLAKSAAPVDKYAGAWTSKDVRLSLNTGASGYTGTLVHQGQNYPITLKADGPGLSGTFTAGGSPYSVLVKLEGTSLLLNTAGTTYMLVRGEAASGNPLAGGSAGSAGARSPQDAQMIQVLTANGWCSFSYSGSSGTYSSGGVTKTQKVFLRPDGTVAATANSERTSSGAAGQAYVGGNEATQGFWKFENGQFYLGQTREQLAPQQFKMTYNSNGYPIPVVNGTEYMICR
jgi:hypothetical protein